MLHDKINHSFTVSACHTLISLFSAEALAQFKLKKFVFDFIFVQIFAQQSTKSSERSFQTEGWSFSLRNNENTYTCLDGRLVPLMMNINIVIICMKVARCNFVLVYF